MSSDYLPCHGCHCSEPYVQAVRRDPFDDYLDLIDWSGRIVREDKKGAITASIPPILERLNIDPETWLKTIRRGRRLQFHHAVGRASKIRQAADAAGRQFLKGLTLARQLFPEPG